MPMRKALVQCACHVLKAHDPAKWVRNWSKPQFPQKLQFCNLSLLSLYFVVCCLLTPCNICRLAGPQYPARHQCRMGPHQTERKLARMAATAAAVHGPAAPITGDAHIAARQAEQARDEPPETRRRVAEPETMMEGTGLSFSPLRNPANPHTYTPPEAIIPYNRFAPAPQPLHQTMIAWNELLAQHGI